MTLISVEITRQENAQHYDVEIGDVVNVPLVSNAKCD